MIEGPKTEGAAERIRAAIAKMEIQPTLSDWQMELEPDPRDPGKFALLLSCRVSGTLQDVANMEKLPERIERKIKGITVAAAAPASAARLKAQIEQVARGMRTELAQLCGHIDLAGEPIEHELTLNNDPDDPLVAPTRPALPI
jgi:hypothetical protein